MTLRARFNCLVAQARRHSHNLEPVCPACRDRRGRIALVEGHRQADGTLVLAADTPTPCALCGTLPEQLVEIVEVVEARVDRDTTEGPP